MCNHAFNFPSPWVPESFPARLERDVGGVPCPKTVYFRGNGLVRGENLLVNLKEARNVFRMEVPVHGDPEEILRKETNDESCPFRSERNGSLPINFTCSILDLYPQIISLKWGYF